MALTSPRPFSAASATALTRLSEPEASLIRSASSIGVSDARIAPSARAGASGRPGTISTTLAPTRLCGTIRAVASDRTRRMEPLVEPEPEDHRAARGLGGLDRLDHPRVDPLDPDLGPDLDPADRREPALARKVGCQAQFRRETWRTP